MRNFTSMSKCVCSVSDFQRIANEKSWNEFIYDTDNDDVTNNYQRCVIRFLNMRVIGNCIRFDNNMESKMYVRGVKHVVMCEPVMIGSVFIIVLNNNKSITFVAR